MIPRRKKEHADDHFLLRLGQVWNQRVKVLFIRQERHTWLLGATHHE
jgi:hypothetical protein